MQQLVFGCLILLAVLTSTGCVTQPTREPGLLMGDVVQLHRQGLPDEALIQQIERRGLAFEFMPGDAGALRQAGVSDGVVRYLEGRASAERDLGRMVDRSRYGYWPYHPAEMVFLGLYGALHWHWAFHDFHRHHQYRRRRH